MSIFNFITQKPKLSLIAIALLLITALMGSSNFKLDASSETLLLENDPDLKLYRDSIDTYGSTDFLVVTVTPFKSIFEESSIDTLKKLINDLLDIQQVENVLSLLDVPLLEPSDNLSLSEVADQVTTLNSDNADISKAKRVFSSNQVYKNLLISEDLKTTAIQLTLKRNLNYENLVNERYQLYDDESSNFDSKLELINEKINKERQEISKKRESW